MTYLLLLVVQSSHVSRLSRWVHELCLLHRRGLLCELRLLLRGELRLLLCGVL